MISFMHHVNIFKIIFIDFFWVQIDFTLTSTSWGFFNSILKVANSHSLWKHTLGLHSIVQLKFDKSFYFWYHLTNLKAYHLQEYEQKKDFRNVKRF